MKFGHGHKNFHCNLCGKKVKTLVISHTLNSRRKRTGRFFLTCYECHILYHKFHNDFKKWGKMGGDYHKKNKGPLYFSMISKGIKIKL